MCSSFRSNSCWWVVEDSAEVWSGCRGGSWGWLSGHQLPRDLGSFRGKDILQSRTWDGAETFWYCYTGSTTFHGEAGTHTESEVSPLLSAVFLKHNSDHVLPDVSSVLSSCHLGCKYHTLAWQASPCIICPLPTFCLPSLVLLHSLQKHLCTISHTLSSGREKCPKLLPKFLLIPYGLSHFASFFLKLAFISFRLQNLDLSRIYEAGLGFNHRVMGLQRRLTVPPYMYLLSSSQTSHLGSGIT